MAEGLVVPIPTDPEAPFPLGRSMVHHDPRNFLFRALEAPPRPPRAFNIPWFTLVVFHQESDNCTAENCIGQYKTSPHLATLKAHIALYDTELERIQLYLDAQKVDPWPGEDYAGTSTDAPFRVLRDRGQIPGWRWLFGLDEAREWLHLFGPVGFGTNWYNGMFFPDDKGRLTISGGLAGGHAYRCVYHSPRYGFRIVNSWGRGWGQQGRAWIPDEIMGQLLAEQGETVTI